MDMVAFLSVGAKDKGWAGGERDRTKDVDDGQGQQLTATGI